MEYNLDYTLECCSYAAESQGLHYVGAAGKSYGIDRFGESGPGHVLFEHFGFTPENIAEEAKELL